MSQVRTKVDEYLKAGVRLVWVIEPRTRHITVHRPDEAPSLLRENGDFDGLDVLPGFRLDVKRIFE